jgi:uracil-DNA glycosylase family 4
MAATDPGRDCPLCPRLVEFRLRQRAAHADWHNAPVPSFGAASGRLLIVGLAPGLQGANKTGRPFTGDYAGDLLYETLIAFGLASGTYDERPDDGLQLVGTRITNAVRCVPPENKPTTEEIHTCRHYLSATIAEMVDLKAVLALGKIGHDSVVRALGERPSRVPFKHGGKHQIGAVTLFSSYHCSRYNTNTGVLTPAMFNAVFADLTSHLDAA